MSDFLTRRFRSVVIPAVLVALSAAACPATAQDQTAARAASAPSRWSTPAGDRSDALCRELDELTARLNAQQRQLEQQARRIEQMGRVGLRWTNMG